MKRVLCVPTFGLAIWILSITCAFAQAQQSYLLRSEGDVRVNGVTVPGTAVVSSGDLIETAKGSVAKIAAPGVSMLIGESSTVSVRTGFLGVDRGSAAVSSNGSILTGASQYSIAPVGASVAKYQIANVGAGLSVFSDTGRLTITSLTSRPVNLLSGEKTVLQSSGAASGNASSARLDSSAVNFEQLDAPPLSGLCKAVKDCFCKTAKECRRGARN